MDKPATPANVGSMEGLGIMARTKRLIAAIAWKRWTLATFAGSFMLSVDVLSGRQLNATDFIYSVIAYVWVYTHPDWKRDA